MTNMEGSNADGACTNRCQKFEPNVFNKSKCQTCFKSKDEHSAKALENTKNSRKILLYCYLFVAPSSFNFDNPLDKTRRWQRRLFVLYDDGELTYSLDENVDTIPQGVININTCLEIKDAEQLTGHKFSIVIQAKDGSKTHVKGSSNEEIERFHNKLKAVMDVSKPPKVRRNFTISHPPVSKEKSVEATPSQNNKKEQSNKWPLSTSSIRNNYLSRPSSSLTEDDSGSRSSRVLSEISNRTISHTVNNGINCRTDSDFSSDVVDSDRKDTESKPTSNGTTFRNLRRLKSRNNEKLALGINNNDNNNNNIVKNCNSDKNFNLRKCLSLQALDNGATSDNESEVRSSNTSVGDIKEFFERSLVQSRNFSSNGNRGLLEQVNGSLDESFSGSNHVGYLPRNMSPSLSPSSLSSSRRQSSMTVIPSPSIQSTASRSQRSSGCTWPYFNTPLSPNSVSSSNVYEDKNIATKLNFDDLLRTKVDSNSSGTNTQVITNLQHRLEDLQNELLNSQNINSLILSEISKFIQLPQTNNRTQKYQISEVQEILTKVNLLIRSLESGKDELEQRTIEPERKGKIDNPVTSPSVDRLKAANDSLNTLLVDRESLIRKLKKEVEKSSELVSARDTTNKILEKNLLQTSLALKASEMKISLCERELTELKGKTLEQERIVTGLQAQLRDGQDQKKHTTSCCDDIKFERDSLLLKVDGLNKLVSNLEKDLSEEKFCRESARKSFLKEVSDFENRTEGDKLMIKNLQEDIEHLKAERSEISAAAAEKNMKISLLASDLSKVEQRLEEAARQNEELKSLSEDYEKQIESLSSSTDTQIDKTSRLDAEINKLISENEELSVKLEFNVAEKSCLIEEMEKLNSELSNLQKEKDQLLEKFSLGEKPSISFSEDEKIELENELHQLREYTALVIEEVDKYKSVVKELKVDHQKKVLQLECEVGGLTEQIKASEKEKKLLIEKKSIIENELNQMSLMLKQAEKDLPQKDKKIQNLEKLISELKPPSEKGSGEKVTAQSASVVGRTADVLQADQMKTSDLEKNNSSLKQQVRKLEVDLEEVRSSSSLKLQELLKKLDLEQRRSSRFCDSLRKLSGGDDGGGGGIELSRHLASLVAELEEVQGRLQERDELVSQLEKKLETTEEERRHEMELLKNRLVKVEDVEVINIKKEENDDQSKSTVTSSSSSSLSCEKCVAMVKERNELCERIKRLQQQMKNLQDDHQHELAVQRAAHKREMMTSKEETMRRLADAEANCLPINEDSIRKTYSKDVNKIKEIYNKGFHSLEKSQQQTIAELKRNHVIELERLRQEKEQLLQEEAAATQAALDAMRKAHEAEVERERRKFLEKLSQTYSIVDIKALQKKHEEDVKFIEVELRQLSEQYSVKCLENAALNERLKQQTNSLHENRKRVQDLLSRNEELTSHMKYEIEKLNRVINSGSSTWDQMNVDGESSTLLNLKEASSQLRQAEIFQLSEQLKNALIQLENANEELKEYREKYQGLQEKMQILRRSNASGSFDGSVNDLELLKNDDDADSTLLQSNNSDWSLNEATILPVSQEYLGRGTSARKLTWKYKGKSNSHGREHLNARLTLEKCKSVDSDHSVTSVGFSESEIFFESLVTELATGGTTEEHEDRQPKVDGSTFDEVDHGYENCGDNASEDDYIDAIGDASLPNRIGDGCSAQGSSGETDFHHCDMNNTKGDKGDDDDEEEDNNSDRRPQTSSYLPYLSGIDFIAHATGV